MGRPVKALSWSIRVTKRHLFDTWKNESISKAMLWWKACVQSVHRMKETEEAELIRVFTLCLGVSQIPNPRCELKITFFRYPCITIIKLYTATNEQIENLSELCWKRKVQEMKVFTAKKKVSSLLIFILFESSLIHTLICGRKRRVKYNISGEKELIFLL